MSDPVASGRKHFEGLFDALAALKTVQSEK